MPPNNEPMWYCYECESEMRPLMVPGPHCPLCNGAFVEMIENPQNDPRAWQNTGPDDGGAFDDLAAQLRGAFPDPRPAGGGFALAFNRSPPSGGNTRTFVLGGPGRTDVGPDRVMPLSEILGASAGGGGGRIMRDGAGPGDPPQNLMINQILELFAQRIMDQRGPGAPNPFADLLGMHAGGPEGGRFGDYVLSQQALDQIMTTLMDNSNANRPMPASEQVIGKLDRQVLIEESPLLEKGCAICKDQFSLQTEDPDEQVVITLPCKHPFHSPCILPWLKQNGTCPTCRHQLVPQPGSTPDLSNNSGSEPGPSTSNPRQPIPSANPRTQPGTHSSNRTASPRNRGDGSSPERSDGGFLGMFGNLLHSIGGRHSSSSPEPSGSDPGPDFLPGSWEPNPGSRPGHRSRTLHTSNQPYHPADGTHLNTTRRNSQTTPLYDPVGSVHGPSTSNRRAPNRDPANERASYNPGNQRRGSYDSGRGGRRDRNGQRRNTHPWDHPDLD